VKSSAQCIRAAAKARSKLDETYFLILCKTYIRLHMEYCMQVLSPYLQKDIQILEKVQQAASKTVPRLNNFGYEDRLNQLGLTYLNKQMTRRLNRNIQDNVRSRKCDKNQFFQLSASRYRLHAHGLKLSVLRCHLDVRKYSFSKPACSCRLGLGSWSRCHDTIWKRVQEPARLTLVRHGYLKATLISQIPSQ